MKRTALILILLLLVAALATPVFALEKPGKSGGFVVHNPHHTQTLGGKSENAHKGLSRAVANESAVKLEKPGK
jgi:hypothetical protein